MAKDLEGIVGAKFVRADDVTRWTYAIEDFGSTFFHPLSDEYGAPDIVVKPQSTQQVSDIVKLANVRKVPIIARGGGEDMTGAATPLKEKGGIILDMTDMNRIINFAGIKWNKRYLCHTPRQHWLNR